MHPQSGRRFEQYFTPQVVIPFQGVRIRAMDTLENKFIPVAITRGQCKRGIFDVIVAGDLYCFRHGHNLLEQLSCEGQS